VTFKNARVLKEVVNAIDLRHLLTETDGPYLTPEPHRGKLNKPAYVKYVVEKIAEIKGMNAGVVADILYQNARNLFKI
jgi:TatD DNase family protein